MVRILLESISETLFWSVFRSHTGARFWSVLNAGLLYWQPEEQTFQLNSSPFY